MPFGVLLAHLTRDNLPHKQQTCPNQWYVALCADELTATAMATDGGVAALARLVAHVAKRHCTDGLAGPRRTAAVPSITAAHPSRCWPGARRHAAVVLQPGRRRARLLQRNPQPLPTRRASGPVWPAAGPVWSATGPVWLRWTADAVPAGTATARRILSGRQEAGRRRRRRTANGIVRWSGVLLLSGLLVLDGVARRGGTAGLDIALHQRAWYHMRRGRRWGHGGLILNVFFCSGINQSKTGGRLITRHDFFCARRMVATRRLIKGPLTFMPLASTVPDAD